MKLLLEKWRGFLEEEKSAAKAVDFIEKRFQDEHASGRPFEEQFDGLNEESMPSEVLAVVRGITPGYITSVLKKYKSTGFKGSINMDEVEDPKEIAVINSILLFTAGNVASVRDPDQFDPKDSEDLRAPKALGGWYNKELAAVPKYYRGKITDPDPELAGADMTKDQFDHYFPKQIQGKAAAYFIKPTKDMYTIAKYVVIQIGNMKNPNGSSTVYRGMSLPPEVLSSLKPGLEFNPGRIASWTTNEDVADKFSSSLNDISPDELDKIRKEDPERFKKMKDSIACVFEIKSAEIGASIEQLSAYKTEHEFIMGRSVKILDIETQEFRGELTYAKIICDEV